MTRKELNDNPEKSPRTNALLDQYRNGDDKNVYDVFALAKSLEEEVGQLREIFPEILKAVDNGSGCMSSCSVQFMSWIPKEVSSVVQNLKFRLTTYRAISKDFADAVEQLIGAKNITSSMLGFSTAQRALQRFNQYYDHKLDT